MINTCTSEFVYDLRGLSSEAKPLKDSYKEAGLGHAPANGSMFFEMDTSKKYMYDEEHDTWLEWKSGGGGGGGGEPDAYLKDAEVDGNVLSITKKDGSKVLFTDNDTTYTAGTNITIDENNVISASGGGSLPTVITDPQDKQILLYDKGLSSWVNSNSSDENSIIYIDAEGFSIKGYDTATQGQMLVKDKSAGIAWVNPVSDASLREAVKEANEAADRASASAIESGNQAVLAGNSADEALMTLKEVNRKIWFGTKAEYNALEVVYDDSIYCILDED